MRNDGVLRGVGLSRGAMNRFIMMLLMSVVLGIQGLGSQRLEGADLPEDMHQLMVQYGRATRMAAALLRTAEASPQGVDRAKVLEVLSEIDKAREYSVGIIENQNLSHLQPVKARNATDASECSAILTSYYVHLDLFDRALAELQAPLESALITFDGPMIVFGEDNLKVIESSLETINASARAAHADTM